MTLPIVVQRALLLMLALLHQLTGHALVGHSMKSSPAPGTSPMPMISTGTEGPASSDLWPLWLVMARTRPTAVPAMITSPWCRVPFWTSRVATGPRPLSRRGLDDHAVGRAVGVGPQLTHLGGEDYHVQHLSIPMPVLAEMGQMMVSPPHSSGTSSYSVSCCASPVEGWRWACLHLIY